MNYIRLKIMIGMPNLLDGVDLPIKEWRTETLKGLCLIQAEVGGWLISNGIGPYGNSMCP